MECNKDEATRAKEIAENKFAANDFLGALKFAQKAQKLFPELEGISQIITTFEVHVTAANKINGEADWYAILGVDPLADDDTVRKKYRDRALSLHPDKNKSIGADGAFKLISEAWRLLSNKAKRVAYNEKINAKANSIMYKASSATKVVNRSYNFAETAASSASTRKKIPKEHASTSVHESKPNTFWTMCHRCKVKYEHFRIHLNRRLMCLNCKMVFMAIEIAPPLSGIRRATSCNFAQDQLNSKQQIPSERKSNAQKNMATLNVRAGFSSKQDPFSRTWGFAAAELANVVQQAYEKMKREREEAQAAKKRQETLQRKQHIASKSYFDPAKRRRGMDENTCLRSSGKTSINGITETSSAKDVSQVESQNLMEKVVKEVSQKVKEIQTNADGETAVKESGNVYQKVNEKGEKSLRNSEICDQNSIWKSEEKLRGFQGMNLFAGTGSLEMMSIEVPDPDFHDFDKDRTEWCFGENQVWAAYDADDGMPRHYAMIHSVISVNPFKMQLRWLNPKTNGELGPPNWVASGLSRTCGNYNTGGYEISNSIDYFSHKVRWRKGADGAICIYPGKGDVWALYRNWSSNWNELTPDEVIQKYDMVEVLEDFSEEHGVIVTPLVKVAGFRTVFHRHSDLREIRIIPKEEIVRFSHQVPSQLLSGLEAPNTPKGCRELDPAATPSDLLQVIKIVKEEDMVMVKNEDTIIKETADDDMKEASADE
ncbi:hypothetical protein VNO77_13326 [Canavalia gladiata]|uniref:J domain-containing protein n=1 Tax=Canavalia gladiata TaxID=3824 RepID=A0AAN9M0V5_CANGL